MQDRYQSKLPRGADERAWLREVIEVAHRHNCAAVSVTGEMWRWSKGRTIAIHVGGQELALMAFATARPDDLEHVARFED